MARRRKRARKRAVRISSVEDYYALPWAEQQRREKALLALSMMRTHGLSQSRAIGLAGISPSAFRRIVGKATVKDGSRYKLSKHDQILRVLVIPVPGGREEVAVRGSRIARQISAYDNAVRHYVYSGDPSRLAPFRGKSIKTGGTEVEFLTDLRQLDQLRRAGALSFESIYARTA